MNIDKTRKVVSIVLMVLMIGTIVFNAFSMVGHCADSSTSVVSGFPLPYGPSSGYGYTENTINETVLTTCLNTVFTSPYKNWFSGDYAVFVYEIGNDYVNLGVVALTSVSATNYSSLSSSTTFKYNWSAINRVYYNLSSGSSSVSFANQVNSSSTCNFNNHVTVLPTGGFALDQNEFIFGYPLYFSNASYCAYDGVTIFGNGFNGHSKGGDITSYTFDPTDIPEPSDPSAVSGSGGWLSKILGGLNKLNVTIGNGFSNIVDNLQDFFNPVFGGIESQLNEIIDKLGGESLDPSDTSLSDVFLSSFQSSKIYGVYSTYNQGRTIVQGLFNSVETPETLRFEFDLPTMNLSGHSQGGSSNPSYITKPYGSKLVMDFGWYEDVRSIVVPFIVAWLYVGMLIWIIRAIPGFISGSPSFNTRSVSNGSPIVHSSGSETQVSSVSSGSDWRDIAHEHWLNEHPTMRFYERGY